MKPLSDLLALRPGGAPWLMRHELRLFVADSAAAVTRALQRAPNRRAMPAPVLGWIVAVYLILHVAAWSALPTLPYWRSAESIGQLHLDGAYAAVLFFLMLSAATIRCVHVMYSRTDLDLLLCSPVPGATILRARLGGVVLGTLLLVLFLVSPIIHVGLLTGRPRLLALYPGLVAMAIVASSLGMMVAIQLARLIGPRHTAIVVQVPGTVVIVALCFMPRLQQAIPAGTKTTLSNLLADGALLGPASPLWLPVRALQGSPVPLIIFCLAAYGLAHLAAVLLQHSFLHVLQQGSKPTRRISGRVFGMRLRFGQKLNTLVLYKEWLLLLRKPMFLNQFAAKFTWLAVAFVGGGSRSLRPLAIAAIAVYAAAALAGALTRMVQTGEQAWDLLASAPVAPATISAAKRWAALIPALLLGMPIALWLGAADPKLGLVTAIVLAGACVSAYRLNQGRASALQMVTSLREFLSNGLWVLVLVIFSFLLSGCAPTDRPDNPAGYTVLDVKQGQSVPALGSVEVVEFFMYSCGHCHALDEPLNAWVRERRGVHFQRVPIAFSARDVPLQRLYFAVQTLPHPEQLHRSIFNAIHRQKLTLDSESAIADFMVRQGIERAAFLAAYRAPGVQQQIDQVLALRHRYAIRAVPGIVVADRFLTSPAMVQGSPLAADTSQPIERATIRMLDYLLAQAETNPRLAH